MDEKPLETLNLIDKLMYEVTNTAAEDGQQIDDVSTDLTLQLPPETNKRKKQKHQSQTKIESAPIDPKHQKLVLPNEENIATSNLKSDDGDENLHDPQNHEPVAHDRSLFNIRKKLTVSDLGNLSRLLVPREMVKKYILPLVDANFVQIVESTAGQQVTVRDSDTETEHQLTFRYLKSSRSYVFNGKWREFVKRRGLKKDDEIGLYWNTHDSKFYFSVLNDKRPMK